MVNISRTNYLLSQLVRVQVLNLSLQGDIIERCVMYNRAGELSKILAYGKESDLHPEGCGVFKSCYDTSVRILRLTLRFAICRVAEKEDIFTFLPLS